MIQHGVHEELYLDVCKFYYEIYTTKSVQESEDWREVRYFSCFIFLLKIFESFLSPP